MITTEPVDSAGDGTPTRVVVMMYVSSNPREANLGAPPTAPFSPWQYPVAQVFA